MRERLLEAACITSDLKGVDTVASRMVGAVSMFGCAPGCAERSLERQGLGHLRYATSGQRELLVCSFSVLNDIAQQLGVVYKDEGFMEFLQTIMDSVGTEDSIKLLDAAGSGIISHHLMKPGELMYLPVASLTWERVVGDQFVIGFRTAHVSASVASRDVMTTMAEQYRAALNNADNPMVKFWDHAMALMGK